MYIKFSPNEHVLRYRRGCLVAEGDGMAFFFLERNTAVCAVPVSGSDMDFIFEETTQDFQTVTIQGQLSCRVVDYRKITKAFDFTVDLHTGKHLDKPMEKLSKRMVNLAHVLIKSHIGSIPLADAIQPGRQLAERVLAELQNSAECAQLGVAVTGFSILKIKATPETARALEAQTREQVLKQSDDALYERRNASIDQERRVRENELNTEIRIEEKKKSIKETQLQTKRMVLEGDAEPKKIEVHSEAEREQIGLEAQIELERRRQELAELRLSNAKKDADAEAYRIGAIMEAYNRLDQQVLIALAALNTDPGILIARAFENLAQNADKIGNLNVSPELLECLKVGRAK